MLGAAAAKTGHSDNIAIMGYGFAVQAMWGNDGIHQIDVARWALGVNTPVTLSGMGRKAFSTTTGRHSTR